MGGLSIPGVSQSNNSGESESRTKATIDNNIDITIKDEANQTQDIATLNRDTDNAHQSLDKIFDKDKEQERLDEQKLISDIGNQLSNIVRTEGQIRAEKAKNDPTALAEAERELRAEGKTPTEQEIKQRAENNAMRDWGVGGKYQQITQAITGALQGVFNGDLTQALANGSAPFLAEAIKNATTNPDGSVNTEANLAAHAILGALLSQANGNSALAGGLGALTAEAAAKLIKDQIYGDKSFADLTEAERQNISALAQIAAAVAGGLAGDSTSDAAQGAIVGKNAVENNYLTLAEAERKFVLEYKKKQGTLTSAESDELDHLYEVSPERDRAIEDACGVGNKGSDECRDLAKLAYNALSEYGERVTYSLLYKDLYPEDFNALQDVLIGLDQGSITRDQAITAIAQASGISWQEAANRYDTAMTAQTVTATLAGFYGANILKNSSIKSETNQNTVQNYPPQTRDELYKDLTSKGFVNKGTSSIAGYETWSGPDGVKITIKPSGEVIRTQRVWNTDKTKKYPERQDYDGNRIDDQSHSTGHFIK